MNCLPKPHVFIPRTDGFLYCACGSSSNDLIHRPAKDTVVEPTRGHDCIDINNAPTSQPCAACVSKTAQPVEQEQSMPTHAFKPMSNGRLCQKCLELNIDSKAFHRAPEQAGAGHTPTPWEVVCERMLVAEPERQRVTIRSLPWPHRVVVAEDFSQRFTQALADYDLIVTAVNTHAPLLERVAELETALADCVRSMEMLADVDGAYRVTCIAQARHALKDGGR